MLALFTLIAAPIFAELIYSEQRDFYLDPPVGWSFLEDPTPEHLVMTDATGNCVLEVFNQSTIGKAPDPAKTVLEKARNIQQSLSAKGDGELFDWSGQEAWLGDQVFQAGPIPARGWFLITRHGDSFLTALAYSPVKTYEVNADQLLSALNSLALGEAGRRDVGPLSAYFRGSASTPRLEKKAIAGLPKALTITYDLDADDSVQSVLERETRVLLPSVKTRDLNPAWTRFYRQIYREIYADLLPLSQYWKTESRSTSMTKQTLAQTVMTWLQDFDYQRKGGLTDISTPWQTLADHAGDCDSRSLIYLAVLDQLGIRGILMVSGTYSHAMAALDLNGEGARFSYGNSLWLVAELTDSVNHPQLGQIASDYSDPNQWLGIDLWGEP